MSFDVISHKISPSSKACSLPSALDKSPHLCPCLVLDVLQRKRWGKSWGNISQPFQAEELESHEGL